ncbi:MAG: Sb-PDE family phosphodiesterase [Puniceicoccaceae bacterium]
MTYKSALLFSASILFTPLITSAHTVEDHGILPLDENRRQKERTILQVPDIKGYKTLKCDLHMHTVFSDGLVWPTIRVQEAWQEGLDVIAITDHLEYQRFKDHIPVNHNAAYETAKSSAALTNIILIRGSEITRNTPPGHFNAIFVDDSSTLPRPKVTGNFDSDRQAIQAAEDQDAFIFWNHPGWKVTSIEGSYEWIPFVDEIRKKGMLDGIEVINGFKFHRKAMDWAIEHDLTILGTSDIHNLIAHDYDMEKGVTRSMSLVFAKERTAESVRQALEEGRTVAWSTKMLAGKEKWLTALFHASVSVGNAYKKDGKGASYSEISNNSDLTFELELVDKKAKGWPSTILLNPQTTRVLTTNKDAPTTAKYTVKNAFVGGYENLVVEIGQ